MRIVFAEVLTVNREFLTLMESGAKIEVQKLRSTTVAALFQHLFQLHGKGTFFRGCASISRRFFFANWHGG